MYSCVKSSSYYTIQHRTTPCQDKGKLCHTENPVSQRQLDYIASEEIELMCYCIVLLCTSTTVETLHKGYV